MRDIENVLILLDDRTIQHIKNKNNLQPPFSHDKILLAFGVFLLKLGHCVIWKSCSDRRKAYTLSMKGDSYFLKDAVIVEIFDLICTSDPVNLPERTNDKTIQFAFQPAVFIAEQPQDIEPFGLITLMNSLKNRTDFVVTQNIRMKEVLFMIFSILAGWKNSEKIVVFPLGVDEQLFLNKDYVQNKLLAREKLGFQENEIVIINAGGVWRWTDLYRFILALHFENTLLAQKKFIFIQPSLKQATNSDHDLYIEKFLAVGNSMNKNFEQSFRILTTWAEAGQNLDDYLLAADVGVNLNQDTFENWMSHRVRFLEYLRAGIPILNSQGDSFAKLGLPGVLVSESNTVGGYRKLLKTISNRKMLLDLQKLLQPEIKNFMNDVQFSLLLNYIKSVNDKPVMADIWIDDIINPKSQLDQGVNELQLITALRNIIVSRKWLYFTFRFCGGRRYYRWVLKRLTNRG